MPNRFPKEIRCFLIELKKHSFSTYFVSKSNQELGDTMVSGITKTKGQVSWGTDAQQGIAIWTSVLWTVQLV